MQTELPEPKTALDDKSKEDIRNYVHYILMGAMDGYATKGDLDNLYTEIMDVADNIVRLNKLKVIEEEEVK